METVLPLFLCLLWHVLVLGAGVWLGINRPWRWKVVREGAEQAQGHRANTHHNEVFERMRQ